MRKISAGLGFSLLLSLTACGNDMEIQDTTKIISTADSVEVTKENFDNQNPAWKPYSGEWIFKNSELIQTSVIDQFPIILREDQIFSDLDISVDFKPLSGDIDASGGIIFRAKDKDNYYIVRANALENNYRLYSFIDGQRQQMASAKVNPPDLGKYQKMRVVAKGDHIQAYLNGELKLDYHDASYKNGYTGLWTKADSVTAFDAFRVSTLEK